MSRETRSLLALSPDENEWLEFKENSRPLNDSYLAMMANAAALADADHATILVGVAEQTDPTTGVTTGRIIGLDEDMHSAEERISAAAANTKPTPVRLQIFQENTGRRPILRVEVFPTLPPHFDQAGRRATRQHTITRAMSDEEVLRLLEAREQERYLQLAQGTADLMMGNLRVVNDELAGQLEDRQLESENALERVADELKDAIEERAQDISGSLAEIYERIEGLSEELARMEFDPADPNSMEHTLAALQTTTSMALYAIASRITELSDKDIDALERLVNTPPDPLAYVRNGNRLDAWRELLAVAFDDDFDISSAVQKVLATDDSRPWVSVREFAARYARPRATPAAPRPRRRRPSKY